MGQQKKNAMELPLKKQQKLLKDYGPWAVVTGASSGIGKEIAVQLAASGLNLIINARRNELLHQLALFLQTTYKVEVLSISGDVTSEETQDQLTSQAEIKDIGLFVAAAGFGTSGQFIKNTLKTEKEMLALNCGAVLRLTHIFANLFSEKKRGGIILLSSIVAFQGTPHAAHYAATKAYVQTLAEGLHIELKPFGVAVLAASPGPVHSEFAARANMQLGKAMYPDEVGISILKSLGKKRTAYPGLLTKILIASLSLLPRFGKIQIMKLVMGGMTKHQSKNA